MKFLQLLAQLSDENNRPQAAQELAQFFNAEDLILFIPDEQLGILLPGPGFMQVLPNGTKWREFLAHVRKASFFQGMVPHPAHQGFIHATGIHGSDKSVAVLIGGNPGATEISSLQDILPLLSALLKKEQVVLSSQSLAVTATQAAEKAERLNQVLEGVRQDLLNTINENAKLLQALRMSEVNYRSMIEGIPQMVWTADPEGRFNYFSHNWIDYAGQHLPPDWLDFLHPEDLQETLKAWRNALSNGKEFAIESRLKRNDGAFRWHLIRAWASLDMDGQIIRWHGTCTDIHEQRQKNEELALMNKELLKINKDLDNFIYTASHDLRAPIANIEGLIIYLLEHSSDQDRERSEKVIELINLAISRFKQTLHDLTEISKAQKNVEGKQEEFVNLREIFEDIHFSLQPLFKEHSPEISLDFQVDGIRFSRDNLRSILYNLVSNALKYRSPERKPVVKIKTEKSANYTVLTVEDNGLGIKKEAQDKVFIMFKRMHNHVEGSGVGLYIVKRIIDDAKGSIEVESEEGIGSKFKVFFP